MKKPVYTDYLQYDLPHRKRLFTRDYKRWQYKQKGKLSKEEISKRSKEGKRRARKARFRKATIEKVYLSPRLKQFELGKQPVSWWKLWYIVDLAERTRVHQKLQTYKEHIEQSRLPKPREYFTIPELLEMGPEKLIAAIQSKYPITCWKQ